MEKAEVSRRLKAARWLAGSVDKDGRVQPLSTAELAQREPLVRNRITANRLSEFERLVTEARDMELRVIADALELPHTWFDLELAPALNEIRDRLDRGESERERIQQLVEQQNANLAQQTNLLRELHSAVAALPVLERALARIERADAGRPPAQPAQPEAEEAPGEGEAGSRSAG